MFTTTLKNVFTILSLNLKISPAFALSCGWHNYRYFEWYQCSSQTFVVVATSNCYCKRKKAGRYFTTIFECSECIPTTFIHSYPHTNQVNQILLYLHTNVNFVVMLDCFMTIKHCCWWLVTFMHSLIIISMLTMCQQINISWCY